MFIVRWISICFTWSSGNGIRLFLQGVDQQIDGNNEMNFPRDFVGLMCRVIIGRYGADVQSEWAIEGSYVFGSFAFSDFLYLPVELTPNEVASAIGLISMEFWFTYVYSYSNVAYLNVNRTLLQYSLLYLILNNFSFTSNRADNLIGNDLIL